MQGNRRGDGERGSRTWAALMGVVLALGGGLALAACTLTGGVDVVGETDLPGGHVGRITFGAHIGPKGEKTYIVTTTSNSRVCLEITWSDSEGDDISTETVELPASGKVPAGAVRWEVRTVECPETGDVAGGVGPPALDRGVQYRYYLVAGGPLTVVPGAADPLQYASYSFWVEARDSAGAAALVAPIVAGGPGTPVSAAVEVLFYNTLVPTPGGALMVTAVREVFDSYRLDWNGTVGYGDLASGHNANLISLPNGWWAVQSVVQDADFVDDPSAPGVDYSNQAEIEFAVPSAGIRTAGAEVVHRYL